MNGIIRPAKERDINSIYLMINCAARKHRVLPRSRREIGGIMEAFFVFETDGKIIACCAVEIYNPRMAEIRSLVVADGYQNQGIGKLLVRACIEKAKKKKIHQILSVTDKVNFFRKCGFDTCLNDQYAMFIKT